MINARPSVLGQISVEEFFAEYWQKKPLLVRNATPEIKGLLVPQDLKELAVEDSVTARLLTQQGANNEQWKVKNAPLSTKDFKKLPPLWTLLVQAVDHFSPEVAALWQHFNFIPEWRRDDIMVSYAPKGGSVGRHFDQYDVFLVQGYGNRRWQLGQYCKPDCELTPNQPLRLLPDMEINFDEVLAPGDLLYVPPTLAHYGVAQDDCLTYSFGFRMPNGAQLLDEFTDQLLSDDAIQIPLADLAIRRPQPAGEITSQELGYLRQQLLQLISQTSHFDDAVLRLLSESKYPDSLPENEPLTHSDVQELVEQGATIQREPAARLIYHANNTGGQQTLEFWALGEHLHVTAEYYGLLKQLADGVVLELSQLDLTDETIELLAQLYEDAIILINIPE